MVDSVVFGVRIQSVSVSAGRQLWRNKFFHVTFLTRRGRSRRIAATRGCVEIRRILPRQLQLCMGLRGRVILGTHIRCIRRSDIHFAGRRIRALVVLATAGEEALHPSRSRVET